MRSLSCFLPLICLAATVAGAHPMGNFSVSHYARFESVPPAAEEGKRVLRVRYVLDLAELPSFELLQKWGLKQDASPEALRKKAAEEMRALVREGLRWKPLVEVRVVDSELTVAAGAGGMPVYRMAANLVVAVSGAAAAVLEFEDANYPDRAGWKEIAAASVGGAAADRSRELTAYPAGLAETAAGAATGEVPQELRARLEFGPGGEFRVVKIQEQQQATPQATEGPAAPGEVAKGDALSALVSKQDLTPGAWLVALGLAFGFGCMHALTPGHGKTMVAAYLVGERGTARHAILLGLTTTFTHTVSVFALGIAMYFLAGRFAPEKVTRILEFVSGASIAALGIWLLHQRLARLRGVDEHDHHGHGMHHHHHDHGHHHHGHDHAHDHHHHHLPGEGEVTMGSLLALGASGGIVPCPSALVLLLSSIALGRVGVGLTLLVSFSLGLASVLVAIGLAVLYAKNLLPAGGAASGSRWLRYVPVASAGVIVVVGLVMTAVSMGIVKTAL